MKKDCSTCFAKCERYQNEEEKKDYCQYYECFCDEVVKSENPECWEDFPPDYYDWHTCDYENGCCKICGKIKYKSMLYCQLYGCDPD